MSLRPAASILAVVADAARHHVVPSSGILRRKMAGRTFRISLLAALVSLPVATLGLNASASAAAPSGKIQIWSSQTGAATSPIIFTGAIGDYGTATSVDKDDKVDENGNSVKIVLQQVPFRVNAVALDKSLRKAKPHLSKT